MGVGYGVSPLHRITSLNVGHVQPRHIQPDDDELLRAVSATTGHTQVADGPAPFSSPTRDAIVTWRDALSARYASQLHARLRWNEDSRFEASAEVTAHDDAMFYYVTAVLDLHGEDGVRQLAAVRPPPPAVMQSTVHDATARGFTGRFPHLLLGASIWLPYRASLMLEEPDWNGQRQRFGSVYRMREEVTSVHAAVHAALPRLPRDAGMAGGPADSVLDASWRAASAVLRVGEQAVRRALPLWTTG